MSDDTPTVTGLSSLATSCGYLALIRVEGCVLIDLKTRLPERNKSGGTIVFTHDQAWEFLNRLQIRQ